MERGSDLAALLARLLSDASSDALASHAAGTATEIRVRRRNAARNDLLRLILILISFPWRLTNDGTRRTGRVIGIVRDDDER